MKSLTPQQAKVLAFVKKYLKDKGYAPTRKEISDNFGWSINAAQESLRLIVKKGHIRVDAAVQRGIVIL